MLESSIKSQGVATSSPITPISFPFADAKAIFTISCFDQFDRYVLSQRQYKVRVSGKMQLLQKKVDGNSPAQNRLTDQKQLIKRKEAALVPQ